MMSKIVLKLLFFYNLNFIYKFYPRLSQFKDITIIKNLFSRLKHKIKWLFENYQLIL